MKTNIKRLFYFIGLLLSSQFVFAITKSDVENFEYHIEGLGKKIKLKDGSYDSDNLKLQVLVEKYVLKDFNKDGVDDALVILLIYNENNLIRLHYELTALLSKENNILQSNSLIIGGYNSQYKYKSLIIKDFIVYDGFNQTTDIDVECVFDMQFDETLKFSLIKKENNFILISNEKYIVKKPALYLYPLKKQNIQVVLMPNGLVTNSIPSFKDKWNVIVEPNGKIDKKYDYLFYEVSLNNNITYSDTGWVVAYNELISWFDNYLEQFSLSKNEINDFKNYWINELDRFNYYEIRLVDQRFIDENLNISITPKPDTFIRLILHFKGTNNPKSLIPPKIIKKERVGFTAVEWGGLVDYDFTTNYSFLPIEKGELILRELNIKDHKLSIRVNSNGCTSKKSIFYKLNNIKTYLSNSLNTYELTFYRKESDFCKAILNDGVLLEYDLKNDFKIDTNIPYAINCKNLIYPLTSDQGFFTFKSLPLIDHDSLTNLKKQLIKATIISIKWEMDRYKQSDNVKYKSLEDDFKKFSNMSPNDYTINDSNNNNENVLPIFDSFGPVMPPMIDTIKVVVKEPIKEKSILDIVGITKSGPFYHVALINENLLKHLSKEGVYLLKVYLVYRKEYFGFIPNYYVYISDIIN